MALDKLAGRPRGTRATATSGAKSTCLARVIVAGAPPWATVTGFTPVVAGKRRVYAHRHAYELTRNGAILFCLQVRQPTVNVNPAHLDIGTCADNLEDMVSGGQVKPRRTALVCKLTVESVREIREGWPKAAVTGCPANQYGETSGAVKWRSRG